MPTRNRPVIGITPAPARYDAPHGSFVRYATTRDYADAVLATGGLPLILPYVREGLDEIVGLVDGLILSGGADIHPARYGDRDIHPATYEINDERDDFEIGLVELALEADKPLLGICRGVQVLNVALGGTLYQDIPEQLGRAVLHRQQEAQIPASDAGHIVTVASGSALETAIGEDALPVNSFHHQGVRDLAPSLEATAFSADGLIEAVQHRDNPAVLGVQWHPELMFAKHERQLALFRHLVRLAAREPALV
jgi:putative glutamine amidotransferase